MDHLTSSPASSSSPAASSLFLEDFGQKVDLTRRIREVLSNYPEGTTVLKELIQNADDAGASKVSFCLDRRVHGVESLLSNRLQQWQGPALLAYNDAVFTEEDFVSISRIGGSGKVGQAWKTGRFGVGFNSVYHLTDMPSFVSSKYVVLFDPQGVYLPDVSTANPGKRIEFVSSSAFSLYEDQFFPYCAFGCDMKTPFLGTLFRFPLRNVDQAASSKLSRQVYTEDEVSSMFAQLYEEGVFTLLFLKTVLCIEMFIWDDGAPNPRKLYSCSVSPVNDDIIYHRQTLLRLTKSVKPLNSEMDSFTLNFMCEAIMGTHIEQNTSTYFIVQTMASASSKIGSFAATASKDYDVHLLPWASIAACISNNTSDDGVLKLGQAFCSLPLPVRTGMSVQINGYFEVSSNRRGIWYGADMDRSGKMRSVWNRLLLEEVVTPSFTQLLLGLRSLLGPTSLYYSLWPSGTFEEPWNILVKSIYRSVGTAPLLYSDINGGEWVLPIECFLHDKEFLKSKELGEALVQLGMPIVHLSNSSLFNMLLNSDSGFHQKVVTPDNVRHFLRECKALSTLDRVYKLILLEYCIEDLVDSDIGKHAYNLSLLPLANGGYGLFSEAPKEHSYFICSNLEFSVLQQVSDRVIDQNIPSNIYSRLLAIAQSSKTNLVVFDMQCLFQLLPRFFPVEWKYKNKVSWYPESGGNHPSSTWFVDFWKYLRNHCEKLSMLGDWPILPSTSGHLWRASRQSKLINPEKLSQKLQDLLVTIGCKTLDCSYGIEHPELSYFVSEADGAGVLESIHDVISSNSGNIEILFHNVGAEERDELRTHILDPKWYIRNCMSDANILYCKRLPIFRVYAEGSTQIHTFSDLEYPLKFVPPLGVLSCLLGGDFINSSSVSEEDILLRYFGIQRMGKARFYRRHVLERVREVQPQLCDKILLSVLQDLPQLCVEDTTFRDYLRNLEFVPTLSGCIKCPALLYDPRVEELYALLDDSDSFPSGVFQESGVLDMLQGLGLRTSVSPETVIQSARQVERLMHTDEQKAHSKGKVLLSYLEVNAFRWLADPLSENHGAVNKMFARATTAFRPRSLTSEFEKFWNDLRMICWCPVLVSAPFNTLPWPVATSLVAPPKLVRLQTDLWLVSASMRILDAECSSTALSCHLGWSAPPGGSVISAQLLELGKNNELVNDQVLRQELAVSMPRIYSILAGLIGSDEIDIVKAILEGCRWVWVGDGFATADEVVLEGPLHLAPYIRVIPVDLAVFRELFLHLGIREFLKPCDYADILCRMASRKGSTALDAQEIRAVILIVQHLAEVQPQGHEIQIYLPDLSGILVLAGDLVYNDAPWFLGSEDTSSSFSGTVVVTAKRAVQRFVHGNISNDVAERLGVSSLRRTLLAASADSMNLGLSGAAEAFGQHEALTTRLRHILEMYADGPGILYELVQNAEDAGASEVIFLLDKTQYGTSSVLSPEMADWQGPALYCFNDSIFSSQDLYAISRIGQESKLEKPLAIGRFGLGFNCVYHFTDVPTFVSGENIVFFDPHACNLPGISPSHPGLRIKFAGRRISEQFPDQFSPYLHFGCDMLHPFPGTLFRFPLRSASAASRSQIKKEGYAPEDVISLFSSFSEVLSEALLFLRSVKTISIYVKEGSGNEMQLVHSVKKHSSNESEVESNEVHNMFTFFNGNQHNGMDKDQFLNKLTKSIGRDLPWRCRKILVTEQRASGAVCHCWITSECLGGGLATNNSRASNNKGHYFIPWACTAAHINSVSVDGSLCSLQTFEEVCALTPDITQVTTASLQDRREFEGRAFCFLPLPISTGLPAHVNAYFELSSNRRDIWFGNDMAGGGKKRSDWNIYLLEDVAAPAYGHLLEKVALEIGPCDLFFSLWPTTMGSEPWATMVRKLYIFISKFGLRVFYTKARGGQWISAKQAILPDLTFYKASELVEVLSDAGLPLVSVTVPLLQIFTDVCPSLHFLTSKLLRTLLIRRKREFKDRNAMILTLEYCLLDQQKSVNSDDLYGLPLIPLANGSFTSFEKKGSSERIYIARADEYGLLKDAIPHQLVDNKIPEGVHVKLCEMAECDESNISFLTCTLLEKLFFRLLPAEWQHVKQVTWVPGHSNQPSLDWMRLLWGYLSSFCDDLTIFSKWPILPVQNNYLVQLVQNSNVIQDDGWSENMSSLLLKVGCLFLRHDLPIEHPQLKNYVQSPTATGLLNALLTAAGKPENIEVIFRNALKPELHELRSFILQSKWFSEDQMDRVHVNIINQLPIFESYKSRQLVSLGEATRWIKPVGVREDLLDDNFIYTESEKERIILKDYLGVREPSSVEFYREYVLNHMSDFLSQEGAVLAILRDVKHLSQDDMSIKNIMSMIPFVLAADGSWKSPSSLYDPRVPELQAMLHKEIFFPSEEFLDSEVMETLISLGLRRSLSFTALLDCARSVSILHESRDSEALIYGRKLLLCLDALAFKLSTVEQEPNSSEAVTTLFIQKNNFADHEECAGSTEISEIRWKDDLDFHSLVSNLIEDKSEHDFWSDLKSIAWCPVYRDTPLQGLPWLISTDQVAAPSNLRPKSQMLMVSSSMHILSGECSTYLQSKLGWTDCVNIEVLSTQLVELSKFYGQQKLKPLVEPIFENTVQEGITMIYSQMQEYIGTEEFARLKTALNDITWVWIGDDFVSPRDLAFDSPVKFSPYLYVVPSELSEYKDLLLALGAKHSFDILDYYQVLRRLNNDVAGAPLSTEQLSFVLCVLEAIADCAMEKPSIEVSNTPLLIPNSYGILVYAGDLVYNDAPWMDSSNVVGKHFIHPNINNHLANRLGIQSLRSLSLVNEEMTKDLPCMEYGRIKDLMTMYGNNEFVLYDLLELADCCKAVKLHLIFDKREHPRQSLLQHNLGDFQGPALVAIMEGASLSREEISSLQLLPPWRLRGNTLSYGLGLFSSYFICDVQSIVSDGYYYIFDPHGLALSVPSTSAPSAKVFSLIGTNLVERFHDQFNPMLIGENMPWSSTNSTIIRMPLSSACLNDGLVIGLNKIKQICDSFMEHASRTLLFLKSIVQVSISTWEEGNPLPSQDYSVSINSSALITRNPFSEKNWRKFHISRLFSSSHAARKFNVIDLNFYMKGTKFVDRWLVVLSLGSGQTRNMALDRRYLAYNLTPVAGVAACISRDGQPSEVHPSSSIMSPLPLSSGVSLPVTVLGCFLVCHDGGRYLFKDQEGKALSHTRYDAGNQLIEAWNRELMSCVRDSYIEMVLELQKLKREPSSSIIEARAGREISQVLKSYKDQIYSFWPRSNAYDTIKQLGDGPDYSSTKVVKADWECIVEQVIRPFYVHIAELPVWQLYSGNLVKASEGMFLSQPKNEVAGNVLPVTVCSFVKEHYPVFKVPWEFVSEVHAVGLAIQEIKPKMVRDLLRVSSSSIILRSVDTFVDVLEYCLSDIQILESSSTNADGILIDLGNPDSINRAREQSSGSSSSVSSIRRLHGMSSQSTATSGEALEMMTSLGKALFDLGRGVVEDIGRAGGPLGQINNSTFGVNNSITIEDHKLVSVAAELRGLPCPTATEYLTRLGVTELWYGNIEQQTLMSPLAEKFIHPKILDRQVLADIFSNSILQKLLKVQSFSFHLLANNMRFLFHDSWVTHVIHSNTAPWFSWDNTKLSGGEAGPSPEWIKLFWRGFSGSSEDSTLFSDWPLIPAFIGRQVLCRVKEHRLVFIPPAIVASTSEVTQPYILAFKEVETRYPWLLSLLNQCNIPIFDANFMDCAASCNCLPTPGQSLSQVIAAKLVAAKLAGYLPELTSFPNADCDELFSLFASDFSSNGSSYGREEFEVLRALPIYKTSLGSYTRLLSQDLCTISSDSFLKPSDERCLSYTTDSAGRYFLQALGVVEYHDQQILVKFGLPGFEDKPQTDQEDILIYIYMNWQDLQADSAVVDALKETKFVRNADEFSMDLLKPKDLFDPGDALLQSVFLGQRKKFPGERFTADGWLRILKKTGLRSATEVDVILECAKRVEFLGNEGMKFIGEKDDFETDLSNSPREVSMETWSLACSVVDSIFTNFAVLYSNNFCNLLGKIACIPAEKGFPSLTGRASGKRVLCSYSGAVLMKDWPLAWSCAPILPKQGVIPPEYSWGALQLRSPPAFSTVLKHLQVIGRNGGEDTLAHWPTASGMITIDEAFVEVLKYLDKVWDSLSASDFSELQRVAFIPAANGTRLVTVSSLFVRLSINLSPFAFELPSPYLPFVRILKELGLQDMLTLACAKDILMSLQRACGYQRLNPNELRAVTETLYCICDKITESNDLDESNWEAEAVVPDDSCRLVHAKACVYVDSYGSRYVKSIDTSRLRFIHPVLPEKICTALGIRKLSDVVVEELDHEEHLHNLQLIGSVQLEDIRKKLSSESFQSAVWTVIKSTTNDIPALKNLSSENIQSLLTSIGEKLKFVQCLHTRFLLLPKLLDITRVSKKHILPEWENENQHRTLYFVSRSKTSIFVAEPPSFLSVLDVIAIIVSHVLGSPTPLPIGPLFLCPEDSEDAVIDILKLCSERRETDLVGSNSNYVGQEILPQDALQVQIHPLRPFYSGEIVAWRAQNGEKLKYGRVPEDTRPPTGQGLYRIKVEIAPGHTDYLTSSHVFSFRSIISVAGETSSATFQIEQSSHTVSENRLHIHASNDTKGKSKSSQSSNLQYGRVSAAELVQAVHEMLSAAGINVDVEKQSLLETTLTLQEQCKESQAALLLEQEKSDVASKEADTAKAAWTCRVCLNSEVDITLDPCGHVLCRRCSSAVSRCPFCRIQVSKTIRMYRP